MRIWRLLWRLICYKPLSYFADVLFMCLYQLYAIAFGLILQAFFTLLPTSRQINPTLWEIIILFVALTVLRFSTFLIGVQAYIYSRFNMNSLLYRNTLSSIFEQPGAQAVPCSLGEAISRFRDDVQNIERMLTLLGETIGVALFTILSLIILLRTDVEITLLVFVPLAGVVIIAQGMKKRIEKYRKNSREATERITDALSEFFDAAQSIRVAGAEKHILEYFSFLSKKRRENALKESVQTESLNSIFQNTSGIGTGLILVLVALSLHTSHLNVGDLALFIYYLAYVTDFTTRLGMILAQYTQVKVSFERLLSFYPQASPEALIIHHPVFLKGSLPEISQRSSTESHRLEALEARDLTYQYPNTTRGISGIDLSLKGGSFTVITGRIGSGKTTLLRTLLGLLPKKSGEICWNELLISDPSTFFVPPHCVYTAQTPHLFSGTLQENILFGTPEENANLAQVLQTAVMDQDICQLEQGLQTVIGTKGVKLSGGQLQRTAIARMLVQNAELLVFDDVSSALDVKTEQALWERLLAIPGKTYLVVSHRKAILQHADHILVLKDGQLDTEGTLEEVLTRSEEMRHLWASDE